MPQELLLRIYAVLRRTYKEDSPLLVLDGCTIDFSRAEVHKGSEIISLTAKEHTLLETLARNAGKIVTVDTLCEALWVPIARSSFRLLRRMISCSLSSNIFISLRINSILEAKIRNFSHISCNPSLFCIFAASN